MHKWGVLKGSRTWNDCRMSYGCGGLRVGRTDAVRSEDVSHCGSATRRQLCSEHTSVDEAALDDTRSCEEQT